MYTEYLDKYLPVLSKIKWTQDIFLDGSFTHNQIVYGYLVGWGVLDGNTTALVQRMRKKEGERLAEIDNLLSTQIEHVELDRIVLYQWKLENDKIQ